MFERVQLQHPPVREVAAGFVFEPAMPYSLICGAMRAHLGDSFPKFEENPSGIMWRPSQIPTGPHARFSNARHILQIGRGMIGINQVSDYNFDDFRECVLRMLDTCTSMGILKDIQSATLRYINFFPASQFDGIEQPFTIHVNTTQNAHPIALDLAFEALSVSASFQYGINIDAGTGVLIDLDTGSDDPTDAAAWIDDAHSKIYQAFRMCLSDKLHQRLGESP